MSHQQRMTEIWERSVRALQAVVRELRVTEDELKLAGQYFNRLGKSGMFPSLLAVGFSMTSIDATRTPGSGTRRNLEGPYYKPGAPLRADGVLFDKAPSPGVPMLVLRGRVCDAVSGEPLAGAEVDLWQADENGAYDNDGFNLRGVVQADASGAYRARTVVPKDYSDHDHDPIGELFRAMGRHNRRAAHIHVKVRAAGHEPLTTQLFIPWSDYIDSDYVEGAVSEDLMLQPLPRPGGPHEHEASFDFLLKRA